MGPGTPLVGAEGLWTIALAQAHPAQGAAVPVLLCPVGPGSCQHAGPFLAAGTRGSVSEAGCLLLLQCSCGTCWLRLGPRSGRQVTDSRAWEAGELPRHRLDAQKAVALLRAMMPPICKAGSKDCRAAAHLPTTVSSSPAMGTPRRPEISAGQPGPTLCTLRPCGSFKARTWTTQAQL